MNAGLVPAFLLVPCGEYLNFEDASCFAKFLCYIYAL